MSLTKRNYIFITLSVAVMSVIFWFSSRDATASTEQSDFFITVFLNSLFEGDIPEWLSVIVRKAAHFSAYAALGFCLYYSYEGLVTGRLQTFLFPLATAVVYAISDEIHQMFVPGRAGRAFDVMIDTFGASFGICVAMALLVVINNIKRRSCQ